MYHFLHTSHMLKVHRDKCWRDRQYLLETKKGIQFMLFDHNDDFGYNSVKKQ